MTFEQPSKKQKKEAKEYWGEDMYELAGHYRRSMSQQERRKGERGEVEGTPQEEPKKAKIVVETMPRSKSREEVLSEVASEIIEKKEKELNEKIDKSRTFQGERLSPSRDHEEMQKFYLTELGYSVKYDRFHDKAKILDNDGKFVLDKKTKKPKEFKTSFDPKGETPIIGFLKEEMKNKIRKDLGGEAETKEEKKEEGKKEKKEFKFFEAFDRAVERTSDFIKKGAKKLAVLGLTPAAVIEDFNRRIFAEPRKFFEKLKMEKEAGRALEKGDKEEWDRLFSSCSERIKELEKERKEKKKSKIWELIKKIKL